MRKNNIFHTHFMPSVFFFISSLLVLVLFKTTNATSLGHQTIEGAGNYKCIDKERDALLHFKAYIHQDPYGFLSTWTIKEEATTDCCKWSGVMCNNQTGHVTSLDLHYGNLEGKISPLLTNLSYLNHLDLSGNSFLGTIPMSIGSLTELRYLHLSDNSFYGTIPSSIGSLTQLRYLFLSYNSFSGTIPSELGNLTNLQELSLNYMGSCTIENLDWLSRVSHLQNLYMDGISLAKVNNWVNVILGLQKLSYLSLCECDLSHVMHPYSYPCANSSSSSIASLYLTNNNLNSSMYQWLSPLTSNRLVYLDISNNKLNGVSKDLGNLCGLASLNFYNNSICVTFSDFLNNLSGCTSVTLEVLVISNNQLTGSLSPNIEKFSSLQVLFLSNNQLNETISEKVWQLPELQKLDVSSNSLKGDISEYIGKTKILNVYLSNNSLEGVPSEAHMSNLSNVEDIDLSSCKLGPYFPKWIKTLKNLTRLNIANNRVSDTVPLEFWNMWHPRLTYLNLSFNNFYGPISNVTPTLRYLDLSKNKFYGGISFLCQIVDGSLYFLDLSHNSFTGEIPDCLWHFKELIVLSLGYNNLSGRIPSSIQYLISLEVLYLYNNNFSGELPLPLNNLTRLTFLDLGDNKFSGYIPVWVGEKLSGLYSVSLKSNNFSGPIPLQLCQLVQLQNLDLSYNYLYGTIPTCLNNLTAMVQVGFSRYSNWHFYNWSSYVDHAMIKWQGIAREFSSNLGMLKSIDMSSNILTGQIPYEITLVGLMNLNLSNNNLFGEIPHKVGEMKELQILDLSRNKFSGGIPLSMSQMTLLNYLDVSYNNLSGRIPSSTQLQSFEPSRYNGNKGLCGLPLTKKCHEDKELEGTPLIGEVEGGSEEAHQLERWFYIGGASGFATGFWMACGALLINHRGRKAFYHFLDSLKDWVYVKVIIYTGKWRRAPHA